MITTARAYVEGTTTKAQRHEGKEMARFGPLPPETERNASAVVESALKVHRALGPGLLESVYETCLCHELTQRGVPWKAQVTVPVVYDGLRLDAGLRLDVQSQKP